MGNGNDKSSSSIQDIVLNRTGNESDAQYSRTLCESQLQNKSNGSGHLNCSITGMEFLSNLRFSNDAVVSVIVYCCFFFVAASGNLIVFTTLFRNRHRKSRVNLFIMHLSMADLIVTFVVFPLETGWIITVEWMAGDLGCRFFMFLKSFGLFLSSYILIAISLDRYFAILHPLRITDADKRGKLMLVVCWIFSALASIPESIIFHLETHPQHPTFHQCVTRNFFASESEELAYNLFHLMILYGTPLIIILFSYGSILFEMHKKAKECKAQTSPDNSNGTRSGSERCWAFHRAESQLRRSTNGRMEQARMRTLKMTIVIVLAYIISFTPYFVYSLWWWVDSTTAVNLPAPLQRGLYWFSISNTCVNPIVYGMYTLKFKGELLQCCRLFKAKHANVDLNDAQQLRRVVSFNKSSDCVSKSNRPSYKRQSRRSESCGKSDSSSPMLSDKGMERSTATLTTLG